VICFKHRCIFVHIPKTGGQSISRHFRKIGKIRGSDTWSNRDPLRGPPRLAHLTAEEYVTGKHVTPQFFNSSFKFSFVRNPWQRVVSEFSWRKHLWKKISFDDWVKQLQFINTDDFCDKKRHLKPQQEFLYDDEENQLVDFIGRYENLQADFNTVLEELKLSPSKLPYINRSSHKDYVHYYNQESKQIIAQKYAKDIEYFGYEFGK
tara:strand:- start:1172 stop:1789 length:618 start_codon:yes stop_codon:yes gene_type:complete